MYIVAINYCNLFRIINRVFDMSCLPLRNYLVVMLNIVPI